MIRILLLNKKRADMYLEEFKLDAVISSSRENTTYLTNFLAVNFVRDRMYNLMPGSGLNFVQVYGIYSRQGESALVLPHSYFMFMKIDKTVTKHVFVYGKPISLRDDNPSFDTKIEEEFEEFDSASTHKYESATEALSAALEEYCPGGMIGIDRSDLHPSTWAELEKLGFRVKDATEVLRFIRMVKSQEELSRLRAAASINERCMEKLFEAAKPGVSEKDLARAYALSVISEDAEFDNVMCPIGTKGGTMIPPTSFKLAKQNIFWVDAALRYKGYFADTGDSASFGKVPKKQLDYYSVLKKVVEKAKDIVSVGMKPSELNSEVAKIWDNAEMPRSPTGMGHGIGLEIHEYPRISAAKGSAILNQSAIRDDFVKSSIDIPFEEGMVLNFESPYLIRGWGGVHLEQTVILGKNGSRPITRQERRIRSLGNS
jgi:Xaa-Pro dipeptidase